MAEGKNPSYVNDRKEKSKTKAYHMCIDIKGEDKNERKVTMTLKSATKTHIYEHGRIDMNYHLILQ